MNTEKGSVLVIVPDGNLTSLSRVRMMARERAREMGGTLLASTLQVDKVEHEDESDGEVVTVWHYRWDMVRS